MLQHFQTLLGELYGIELPFDVHDFLITDAELLGALENPDSARTTEEKLLICESAGELSLSLYLAPELLERLASCDPRERLGRQNFADFCTMLEGVSHFHYVAWNASADKAVTLHELEMQAEVDKYVGALALLAGQSDSVLAETLYERLFDAPRFAADLAPEELERYRSASAYAATYCHHLAQRFPHGLNRPGMLDECRAFYRLPQPEKISHIRTASFA